MGSRLVAAERNSSEMETYRMSEILESWQRFELDDEIYVPSGVPLTLDTKVTVFTGENHPPHRIFGDSESFLIFEQIRNQVEGFEEYFGRTMTLEERLIAVVHYAEFDAPINPVELLARGAIAITAGSGQER